MNGKGSRQRPRVVSYEEYAKNYDQIFEQRETNARITSAATINALESQTPTEPQAAERPGAEDGKDVQRPNVDG